MRHFAILCCLTLVACFSVFNSSYAQSRPFEAPDNIILPPMAGIVGPCDPSVYMQLTDIAQMNAELEKILIDKATDEQDDPSIMSLSCFEGDVTKMLDAAEGIIKSASSGLNLNTLINFYNSNKNQIKQEIAAAAGKFACENIKAYVQSQLDQCFDFRLIEKQSVGQLGNQACLISADANITISRHGYAYTGINASGQVSGPGGYNESVLLGANIVDGLESLYSDWSDSGTAYTQQGQSCSTLSPTIQNGYPSNFDNLEDYYDSLEVGELPSGVALNGNDYEYASPGTYTVTVNGSVETRTYEDNALCYGFTPTLPYAPCGFAADGTPAPCGSADDFDPSCCDVGTTDCSRSGLDTICPCNQGNLLAALDVEEVLDENGNVVDVVYTPLTDPVTGGPACQVGVPTCCHGGLNDCTLPEYAPYEYCEGTEPEPEVPIDCQVELDNIIDTLQLTQEQVIDRCPQDFVQQLRRDMTRHCARYSNVGSGCKQEDYCDRVFLGPCVVDDGKADDHIASECQVFVSNQETIDSIDPELLEQCDFDFTNFGPYVTPSFESDDGSSTGIPIPTPVGNDCISIRERCLEQGTSASICSQNYLSCTSSDNPATATIPTPAVTVPTPTVSTPTIATPTTTPSAGSTGNTNSGGNTGSNIPSGLF